MWSSRCIRPNFCASYGQESKMAWVGAATRKGFVTVPSTGSAEVARDPELRPQLQRA
jgi:hypothetical protein